MQEVPAQLKQSAVVQAEQAVICVLALVPNPSEHVLYIHLEPVTPTL